MTALNTLLAATVAFVGGHFLLSSLPVRGALIRRLGDNGFRILYSLVAIASFVWMLFAYGAAPYLEVWLAPLELRWLPLLLMPFGFILVVAGLTTRSPTAVGGETLAEEANPAPGILRITRHPFLWGAAIWAGSHLAVKGDAASLILMGGILVLTLGGMQHMDRRREAMLGGAWGPMKLTTSALPFAALLARRTQMDWRGLGWWRPLLGLALYAGFLHLHEQLFGVSALPL